MGTLKGKWPQQHGIDDAEDGGGAADAQRQRQHGDRADEGVPPQVSQGIDEIPNHAAILSMTAPTPAWLCKGLHA
jgi:hypothetical protein